MKNKFVLIPIALIALIIIYYVLGTASSFSYLFHPFYNSCVELSTGMTDEEAKQKMKIFIDDPDYRITSGNSGNYGWKQRMSYSNSLDITLGKDPWYKIDQHLWRCTLFFNNNLLVEIEPFFD